MTDGRFETSYNLRPGGWDSRPHWTKTHKPFRGDPEHVRDHMERESCPYHDLRADGCFQPEYAGLGLDSKVLRPDELVRRKDGNRLATGGLEVQHRSRGMGGVPIPHDVEPASPMKPAPSGGHAPWKASGKKPGAFSTYEYMPSSTVGFAAAPAPRAFSTGRTPVIGAPVRHVPEPYSQPRPYGRKPFRLATGVAHRKDVIGPAPPCPPIEAPRRAPSAPRAPMASTKSQFGTFSHYPPYHPEPTGLDIPTQKKHKWALFTYAAKTKRSMPVDVPWKHGSSAAEPPKPDLGQTNKLAQTTGAVTARGRPDLQQTELLRIK